MSLKSALIISIGLNVALTGYIGYVWLQEPPAASRRMPTVVTNSVTNYIPRPPRPDRSALAFDWQAIEAASFQEYISNLRTLGCPEATIRDIIIGKINRIYEKRQRELVPPSEEFAYWETGNPLLGMLDEETIEKQHALDRKKRELLTKLFGEEALPSPDWWAALGGVNPFDVILNFLSPTKQARVVEVEQAYALRRMKALAGQGPLDEEDRKRLVQLRQEKEAALASILSSEEKAAYDLRMSETANALRQRLEGFAPTQEEFDQIFALHQAFEQEHGRIPPINEEERPVWEKAQAELEGKIRNYLGEERFAHYQRVQDRAYQVIAKVAERQGISTGAAVDVYKIKEIAEREAGNLKENQEIPTDRKEEALQQIRKETERAIMEVLGEEGLQSYKELGADWLDTVSPVEPDLDAVDPTIVE